MTGGSLEINSSCLFSHKRCQFRWYPVYCVPSEQKILRRGKKIYMEEFKRTIKAKEKIKKEEVRSSNSPSG